MIITTSDANRLSEAESEVFAADAVETIESDPAPVIISQSEYLFQADDATYLIQEAVYRG